MSEKIAGVMALGATVIVVMMGIYFKTPFDDVVLRAGIAMVAFYLLGFFFGELGIAIVLENIHKFDLEQWEATEGKKIEERYTAEVKKIQDAKSAARAIRRGRPQKTHDSGENESKTEAPAPETPAPEIPVPPTPEPPPEA